MITTPNINDSTYHELQNEIQILKSEMTEYKDNLLKLWIQVSKSFNDDFEEILELGIYSDISDIMNALLIVEEARQEQINNDKKQIVVLNEQLQQQQKTIQSKNEELRVLDNQCRQLNELVIQQQQWIKEKDLQIADLNKETSKLKIEVTQMVQKLNDLSTALIQVKEEKIKYMEQTQNQIKILMEKDLHQSKYIQMLQIQKIELENSLRKYNQRNSNEQILHLNFQAQREQDQIRLLSCSPRTTHTDFSKIFQQTLQSKKAEMVSGSSHSQIPYRFGK